MFSARSLCSRRETLCVSARDRHVRPHHPSRLERAEVDRSRLRLRTSDQASAAAHVSSDDQTAVTFLAEVAEDISQKIAESFFLNTLCFSARNARCSLRDPCVLGERFSASPGEIDTSTPAAVAGYPSVTVPAGFVHGLPVGVSFIGRAWREPKLITLAYAYEQATKHRRPPTFPPTIKLP